MFKLTWSFISGFVIYMLAPLLLVRALSRAGTWLSAFHFLLKTFTSTSARLDSRHAKLALASSLQNGKYFLPTLSQSQLDGSSSIFCFSKHQYHFVTCKAAHKMCCLRAAEVGGMFFADVPSAKVFLYICLHLLSYMWHCASQ